MAIQLSLKETLLFALESVKLEQEDSATRELALILAEQIDIARDTKQLRTVAELSSKLITILVEMQMTPKARKTIKALTKEGAVTDDNSDAARALRELQSL